MRHTHPRTGVIALARQKLAEIETVADLRAMPDSVRWATERLRIASAERRAAQFAEAAIWFAGAVVALSHEHADVPVDPGESIVSQIDAAELSLQDLRHRVLRQIGHLAQRPSGPGVSAALRAVACSSADLHDALVRFKWAVIECDTCDDESDFFEWLGLDARAGHRAPSGLAGLRAAVPALRQSWWQRKAHDMRL